ncbi:MAG: HlyD family efflux transporter periplasmic adaptor subunit [Actinomycetota bacterium]|nr:MAG: hypothetical protein FD171_181 [Actinomycetota bacterium]MDO8949500.1 HlyD family efflux transporter periplasmic adaptor subunit [Actinomycetota bacterium]MDP3630221.1 HlyD family efflux transporter periplasmic adaptor subunit [Actinomycetota bacterium]
MSEERTTGVAADVRKRLTIVAVGLVLLGVASYAVSYFQRQGSLDRAFLEVAGNVRAETYTVRAPALTLPTPDYTVGIPSTAAPKAPKRTSAAVGSSGQPVVSGRLTAVYVTEGDRIVAGAPLAKLETTMLDLGVQQALTAATKARADVAVLGDTLNTLGSTQADLAKAKRDLQSALAKAKVQRADLAAQLAQLQSMPTPPPGSVPPSGTPMPNRAALIARLKSALTGIDAGIAKMSSGLRTMASGSAKLADAKTTVRNGRDLLTVVADGRDVAVDIARARLNAAVITSPVGGLVIFARRTGDVAMMNAPLVKIRPDSPALVDTYLTAEQLAHVRTGARAEVTYDSSPGSVLTGRITSIADSSAFPPTAFPTDIVHMTRTTRVTITLDDGERPPAGTPVDITIRTDSRG